MNKLIDFLSRLDSEKLSYTLKRPGYGEGITVLVDIFCELWEVSFEPDGEVETVIYECRAEHLFSEPAQLALEDLFDRCSKTWLRAARDLGFEFTTPFTFQDPGGCSYSCAGLLKYFGGPKGTLILSHKCDDVPDAVDAAGYYTSGLNPSYYYRYDRDHFIETLSDWGWYGSNENKPSWLITDKTAQ